MCLGQSDSTVLEQTILGPRDSNVRLTLRSIQKGNFDFVAKRHVPIRVWDQVAVTRSVRQDLQGKNLLAEASIVDCLESIRKTVLDPSGNAVDFFRDMSRQDFQCSLGLVFALELNETELRPCQVFFVVPGSPASLVGAVLPGDEVVAVDGVEADESNLVKLIQDNNVIGSSCTLSIIRNRAEKIHQPGLHDGFVKLEQTVQSAEVVVNVVSARDLPKVATNLIDPFVCVSILDQPADSTSANSLSDDDNDFDPTLGDLDHVTLNGTQSGALRYSRKRSDSGRHVIKHALAYQPDPKSRLQPQVRTRTLERTLDPQWNETFALRNPYSDVLVHRQHHKSLQGCPTSRLHGQQLLALVTLHADLLEDSHPPVRGEEEDGWCGRVILPNIRPGQSIDGWFPLQQSNGLSVMGMSGRPACVHLKITYSAERAVAGGATPRSFALRKREGKHFDVTLSRVKQSRIDKFQEIVSWFTLLEREFEHDHQTVLYSLESLQKLVVSLEEERCEDELRLAHRLYTAENQIAHDVLRAESALHGLDDLNDYKLAAENRLIEITSQNEHLQEQLEQATCENERSQKEASKLADSAQVLSRSNGDLVKENHERDHEIQRLLAAQGDMVNKAEMFRLQQVRYRCLTYRCRC